MLLFFSIISKLSLQSALQPVPASPGYIWATMPTAADVIYQTPQAYQGAELADAAFVDGATVEVMKLKDWECLILICLTFFMFGNL